MSNRAQFGDVAGFGGRAQSLQNRCADAAPAQQPSPTGRGVSTIRHGTEARPNLATQQPDESIHRPRHVTVFPRHRPAHIRTAAQTELGAAPSAPRERCRRRILGSPRLRRQGRGHLRPRLVARNTATQRVRRVIFLRLLSRPEQAPCPCRRPDPAGSRWQTPHRPPPTPIAVCENNVVSEPFKP